MGSNPHRSSVGADGEDVGGATQCGHGHPPAHESSIEIIAIESKDAAPIRARYKRKLLLPKYD